MNNDFISFELAIKLQEKGFSQHQCDYAYIIEENHEDIEKEYVSFIRDYLPTVSAPTISQVLKWLREEKNIDIEIHADVGMLGIKVYSPYISTYTEFTLETSPDVIRYRQNKFSPITRLPHEIIPAHIHFEEWEQAAITGIEYVLDKLI